MSITLEHARAVRDIVGLSPAEAIERLTYCRYGVSPMRALAAAFASERELVPLFIGELERTSAEIDARWQAVPDGDHFYFLHTAAIYTLALFEEKRAWPLILHFFSSDPEVAKRNASGHVYDDLPAILARCYDGSDWRALIPLIEEERLDEFARQGFLRAVHALVHKGHVAREEFMALIEALLDAVDHRTDRNWTAMLALAAAETRELQFRERIAALFDRGLIDEPRPMTFALISRRDVERTYAQSDDDIREEILGEERFANLSEVICGWDYFTPDSENGAGMDDDLDDGLDPAGRAWNEWAYNEPYVREHPKIGRNDPCPCGSGKKYKKCCLGKD